MKVKNIISILIAMAIGHPVIIYAKQPDDFKTNEYLSIGNNVLDIINAAETYAAGFTGKGVTIGVTDLPANFRHPEFNLKTNSGMVNFSDTDISDWSAITHGTHIVGIIGADKNNSGMHGVAFDANIKASSISDQYKSSRFILQDNIYKYYLTHPEIKTINNSWGSIFYLSEVDNEAKYQEFLNKIQIGNSDYKNYLQFLQAVKHNKLLIFASGNSGHTMPTMENLIANLDKTLSHNFLSVTASDTNRNQGRTKLPLIKNKAGGFDAASNSILVFSDLVQYREDNSINAPGAYINSANANFLAGKNNYSILSGTSVAAPIVTGGAALVQQAFPYLNGKQIADVLLSTANNNITATDGYFVTIQNNYDRDGAVASRAVNVFYTNSKSTDINSDLDKYQNENSGYLRSIYNTNPSMTLKSMTQNVFENTPIALLFGQGILDTHKAVKGLAAINVRRLTSNDINKDYTVNGVKQNQALYTINTAGYHTTWSNDIIEIRAGKLGENPLGTGSTDFNGKDKDIKDLRDRYNFYKTNWLDTKTKKDHVVVTKYIEDFNSYIEKQELIGLHAGLYKEGEGILTLTGNNTYQGSSIAAKGTLQIDGSVAADAYSLVGAGIAGKGSIGGNLYNDGQVQAGSNDGSGDLTIAGNLSGSGGLVINTDGKKFNTLKVGNHADITKMTLKAGTNIIPNVTGDLVSAKTVTPLNSITTLTGLLNIETKTEGANIKASTIPTNNTHRYHETFSALNKVYTSLNKQTQPEMYKLYAFNTHDATIALQQLTGGFQMEIAHDIIKSRDIQNAMKTLSSSARKNNAWVATHHHQSRTDQVSFQGLNITTGKDFLIGENHYWGGLFSYSKNHVTKSPDKGDYQNYQFALYAGTLNRPGILTGYISYGMQTSNATRHLVMLDKKASSHYTSSTLSTGVKYAYNLYHHQPHAWQVIPYIQKDVTYYQQNAYTERNAGIYNQHSDRFSDYYLSGEIGMDIKRQYASTIYEINLGYRNILNGHQQSTNVQFANNKTANLHKVTNTTEGQNHIITSASISHNFNTSWSITARIGHHWSANSRALNTNVQVNYQF